ncbi:hypothetical protein N7462_006718 [Penicillium macrosclerotiorum]|uniref:uncharacterized protein n=1 Tax=Penicillium macrosclerotiorum TaxID=303699 RepID=UPI002546E94C|nr:uncharacterized protein N7462_006718 [Penicillium macrosclerotiorum]KAJ5683553.1 hypothetical protein N7462_006718 [Penicillium macrosclerotiorum]
MIGPEEAERSPLPLLGAPLRPTAPEDAWAGGATVPGVSWRSSRMQKTASVALLIAATGRAMWAFNGRSLGQEAFVGRPTRHAGSLRNAGAYPIHPDLGR